MPIATGPPSLPLSLSHAKITLQSGPVNDLHIDDQLPSSVIDHQGTHAAAAIAESTLDASEQAVLVNDRQSLFDVARLGHGHNQAVLTNVQDTILLEDGALHGLHHHAGGRVADEGTLLVQLTGEQIHAQVAVLAGLGRHADADHLTRTALKEQNVANANKVALDGNASAAESRSDMANLLHGTVTHAGGSRRASVSLGDDDLVAFHVVSMVERVQDAVGGTLDSTAEAVVLALVVVVAHVVSDGLVDLDFFLLNGHVCLHGTTTFVFNVVGGVEASAVVSLGQVELRLEGSVVGVASVDVYFDVVSGVAAVDVDVDVNVGGSEFPGCTVPFASELDLGMA